MIGYYKSSQRKTTTITDEDGNKQKICITRSTYDSTDEDRDISLDDFAPGGLDGGSKFIILPYSRYLELIKSDEENSI